MDAFRGYVQHIVLASTSDLVVHRVEGGRVFVLEYEVHGTILATGRAYHNRFCSIVTVANRKITHWRDYMDRSRRGTRSPPERTIFTRSCSPRATGLLC
jgi:ketosteroid isomerase-like protein